MVCRRRCVPCVLMNTKTWHSRDSVRRMRCNSRQRGLEWKEVEALPGERKGHGRLAGAPTADHSLSMSLKVGPKPREASQETLSRFSSGAIVPNG
jgi:hypothetical protein